VKRRRRRGERRGRGRPRRLSDQVLAWAEEQIALGLSTKPEVLELLGIHRTTYERRLRARGRRLTDRLTLPPGGFRCHECLSRSIFPICTRCGAMINPLLALPLHPPTPPAA
jgi:hypothetical protein